MMNYMLVLIASMVVGMIFLVFLMRYFIHLERMAMIKQGFIPPALMNPIFRRGSFGLLLAGLITGFSGLSIIVGLYYTLGNGFWLISGLLPIGVGAALICAYMFGGHTGGGLTRDIENKTSSREE